MSSARAWLGLPAWLLLPFAAAAVGSRFIPGPWYASLVKPAWNPPNWIFGPVWTLLCLLMGIAAWLVWRRAGWAGARLTLGLFIVQLALNALWSYLFFGIHRPDLAFVDICALWGLILTVTVLFGRHDRIARALFLPYLAWVGFAAVLNFTIWRLNAGTQDARTTFRSATPAGDRRASPILLAGSAAAA